MIFTIARRNLWRNRRRTLIVISSVIAGVVAIILNDSVGNGIVSQMLDNQINLHTSHIQIHQNGFNENKSIQAVLPDPNFVEDILNQNSNIATYSKRTIAFGLLNSANSSAGATFVGIEPEAESKITSIKSSIIEGKYPEIGKRDILIGKKMAEKLEVEVGGKIVAVTNSSDGNVNSELFRVSGIFRAGSSDFENSNIYIPYDFAENLLELGGSFHEFAIVTNSKEDIEIIKTQLSDSLGDEYEILSYRDLLPLIVSYIEAYKSTIIIFYIIIGLAVLFGIINTMLMSVFERVQEFGVLMAIGMKNKKIYLMVVLESLVIGVIGSIFGFIIGMAIYLIISNTGIDLRAFSESLESMGLSAIIFPSVNLKLIINSMLVMPVTSVIGALYPAYKAIKLQPTDAIRYV
ncbi:MAG: ABC transporter permease [Candidatus Kapabacteria bacterium]|nr:ABC transporter permease [Ignavibacteriota bacterium]MCW5886212.1 ABC transporter permease [Candidatus Kapabacteria bacterium]